MLIVICQLLVFINEKKNMRNILRHIETRCVAFKSHEILRFFIANLVLSQVSEKNYNINFIKNRNSSKI